MRLFVDDTRKFPEFGYECCKDYNTATLWLSMMDFEYISLDYDLGYGCKTGLDILKWMKSKNISVPKINIHSNHPGGKERMRKFCEENFPDSIITINTLSKR